MYLAAILTYAASLLPLLQTVIKSARGQDV